MFVSRHKTMFWYTFSYLWIIDLEKKTMLSSIRISLFRYFVTRTTNLHKLLDRNFHFLWSWL